MAKYPIKQLTADPIDCGSGRHCDSGGISCSSSRWIFLQIAVSFCSEALEHPIPVLRHTAGRKHFEPNQLPLFFFLSSLSTILCVCILTGHFSSGFRSPEIRADIKMVKFLWIKSNGRHARTAADYCRCLVFTWCRLHWTQHVGWLVGGFVGNLRQKGEALAVKVGQVVVSIAFRME